MSQLANRFPVSVLMPCIKLMRIPHWVKNLLVLFPVVFAGQLLQGDAMQRAVLATVAFCLASSAVYVFNDLRDLESDRAHPVKCNRPLASGAVSRRVAILLMCASSLSAVAISCFAAVGGGFAESVIYIVGYLLLNVCYSLKLKAVPVADIAVLATGFLIRVLYGGAVCGVQVSSWLFLTVLALSFWLALGKRRGELAARGSSSREVLGSYTIDFLTENMNVFLGCGLTFYALWAVERGGMPFTASVFLAMLVCLRYGYVSSAGESGEDPVENLLGDAMSLALVALWAACLLLGLYL